MFDPLVPPVAGVDPDADGVALMMTRNSNVERNYPLSVARTQCILENNANGADASIIELKGKVILEEDEKCEGSS